MAGGLVGGGWAGWGEGGSGCNKGQRLRVRARGSGHAGYTRTMQLARSTTRPRVEGPRRSCARGAKRGPLPVLCTRAGPGLPVPASCPPRPAPPRPTLATRPHLTVAVTSTSSMASSGSVASVSRSVSSPTTCAGGQGTHEGGGPRKGGQGDWRGLGTGCGSAGGLPAGSWLGVATGVGASGAVTWERGKEADR